MITTISFVNLLEFVYAQEKNGEIIPCPAGWTIDANGMCANENKTSNDLTKPRLGVEGYNMDENTAYIIGTKQDFGAYIKKVNQNSTADTAGIKKGDIIVGMDKELIHNFDEVLEYLDTKKFGDTVLVKFIRDNELKNVTAKLIP